MSRLVNVAVPVPQLGLLTYRVPEGWAAPVVGARVLVPLGARRLTGCVTGEGAEAPAGVTRDLLDLLDDEPFLPAEVVELALWVADYYLAAPGEAIAAAMPPLAWVASRSVPTTLALEVARAAGLPLVARAPGKDARVYLPAGGAGEGAA